VAGSLRVAWLVLAGSLLPVWPCLSQVRVGELSTDLSGTVSTGYSANYGNLTSSNHGWVVGGAGNLSGNFYNPNFLSFNAGVYLNQSRANSNFQSISDASGVNITSNIFSGSHFPGSISYSKDYNSQGNYAVPGLANFVTHGNSDTFGINWSENLPEKPTFSAGFQLGSSKYSVYGTNDQGKNGFHSLNLNSSYRLAGFSMGAYYSDGAGHSLIPQVVSGLQIAEIHSGNSGAGFNVNHQLPMHGTVSAGINRSHFHSDYLGFSSSGAIDTINTNAAVHPTSKLSVTANADYSDNLSGQLFQSVVAAGGILPGIDSKARSNSLDLMAVANYTFQPNLQGSGFAERRTQYFLGNSYGVTSYGGSASYTRRLFDGSLNSSLTVTANKADTTGMDTLGLSANANYSNNIMGWLVTGSFGYAQNVQTLLVTYMNSFYYYSGNVRRRWGKFSVGAGGGASRTGLTQQQGTVSSSESYNASLGYSPLLTATGSYSKANGQALVTGAGLVPVPTPIVPSSLLSLYGGNSYSFGLASSPAKKLTIAANYSKSTTNTVSAVAGAAIASRNDNEQYNALIQYQFRKMTFNSGYARLQQGFSQSGTKREVISSYYMGISRWFNFF
jgi:hypothetical protein